MERAVKAAGGAVLIGLGVAVVWAGGYGFYLDRKLKPLRSPGASLVPHPFVAGSVGETRAIDLGFASFGVPTKVGGDLWQAGDAMGMLVLGAEQNATSNVAALLINLPRFQTDKNALDLLASYNKLSPGAPAEDLFALEEATFETQPFTVWAAFKMGRRESVRRGTLWAIKDMMLSRASQIETGTRGDFTFYVLTTEPFLSLMIHPAHAGFDLNLLVPTKRPDARAIINAIIQTYKPNPDAIDKAVAKRLLTGMQVPVVKP